MLVEEGEEDQLFALEECDDGTTSLGESIELPDGTFENEVDVAGLSSGEGLKGGAGTGFQIENSNVANKLFKFTAENSKVEFGLIETRYGGSVLMTNHHSSQIAVTQTAVDMDSRGQVVDAVYHNHPKNNPPSYGIKVESGKRITHGDIPSSRQLIQSGGQDVIFGVYTSNRSLPNYGNVYLYNHATPRKPGYYSFGNLPQ